MFAGLDVLLYVQSKDGVKHKAKGTEIENIPAETAWHSPHLHSLGMMVALKITAARDGGTMCQKKVK